MPDADRPDQKRFVRFDFPPGATSKEIAVALQAAREQIMAKKRQREQLKGDGGGEKPA
jgi:hypothetical protein